MKSEACGFQELPPAKVPPVDDQGHSQRDFEPEEMMSGTTSWATSVRSGFRRLREDSCLLTRTQVSEDLLVARICQGVELH